MFKKQIEDSKIDSKTITTIRTTLLTKIETIENDDDKKINKMNYLKNNVFDLGKHINRQARYSSIDNQIFANTGIKYCCQNLQANTSSDLGQFFYLQEQLRLVILLRLARILINVPLFFKNYQIFDKRWDF